VRKPRFRTWAPFVAICVVSCTDGSSIADGTYYGYEHMISLSPEDLEASWYHEQVLTVRNGQVLLQTYPRWIKDGVAVSSASDGGFYTYKGAIRRVAGKT
jgi:hypothetical protein